MLFNHGQSIKKCTYDKIKLKKTTEKLIDMKRENELRRWHAEKYSNNFEVWNIYIIRGETCAIVERNMCS